MSDATTSKAAYPWDTADMNQFGIFAADAPLSFRAFFGFDLPNTFGVDLPERFQKVVEEELAIFATIGTLGKDADIRLREIEMQEECAVSETMSALYRDLAYVARMYPLGHGKVAILTRHTVETLRFGHIQSLTSIVSSPCFPLRVAGIERNISPDVTVEVRNSFRDGTTILLIQEDKSAATTQETKHFALPQLIVGALAAFKANKHYMPMSKQTIFGIAVRGTVPTFYKIEVNNRLLKIVEERRDDEEIKTFIQWCCPLADDELASFHHPFDLVVKDAGKFRTYLKAYEAMRRLLSQELKKLKTDTESRKR